MDLPEAELDVLKVLWEEGPVTVRLTQRVLETRGRRWAYSTVATLIQRLAAKGLVETNASAIPHVYRALVSREELLDQRLKDAANELYGGKTAPLVLALVQGGGFSDEELDRFGEILEAARGNRPLAAKAKGLKKRK